MKKTKRILAILLIVILVALYASTLIFALIGSEKSRQLLAVSVVATVVLPVLLYIYGMIYKMASSRHTKD